MLAGYAVCMLCYVMLLQLRAMRKRESSSPGDVGTYRTAPILPRHSKKGFIIFFRASNARLFWLFWNFALPKNI